MKRSSMSRKSSTLSGSLGTRVASYAMAAGASGVGLLALAPLAGAEIVYTPATQTIGRDGSYKLDLNNDGIGDFLLTEHVFKDGSFGATDQIVSLEAAAGNQAVCPSTFCISGETYADPLTAGVAIRPDIQPKGWIGRKIPVAFEEGNEKGGGTYYGYGWTNIKNHYLGLKFKINGEYHYGWARLSVRFNAGSGQDRTWVIQLSGYAYETVAGKSIITGQTSGSDESKDQSDATTGLRPESDVAALSTLALGTAGLALRRE